MPRKATKVPTVLDDLQAIVQQQVKLSKSQRHKLSRNHGQQWRFLLGILLAMLAMATAMSLDGFRRAAGESVVRLRDFTPATSHLRSSTRVWSPAVASERVDNGDTISTDRTGRAHLAFPDGSLVSILPLTIFSVRYCGYERQIASRDRSLDLLAGRVFARVSHFVSDRSTFTVSSPCAMAGVRGTRLSVAVLPSGSGQTAQDATCISVHDGQVNVVTARGEPVAVGPSQQVIVWPRMLRAPVVTAMTPSEKAAWDAERQDPGGVFVDGTPGIFTALCNAEEKLLVAPMCNMGAALGIGGAEDEQSSMAYFSGPRAYMNAMVAARALQIAMENSTDSAGLYPRQIGLKDLAGLTLSADKAISLLANFDGNQVLSYRRTTGGFLMYVRANRPSSVLIQITNEGISEVGNGGRPAG